MSSPNLEALITEEAERIADQMNRIAQWAKSEEDVRYECNKLLDAFLAKANLKIKGRHEYGLAGGRIDSKYAGVIIEYKDPHGSGKITEDRQAPGTKAVIQQLRKRFEDFQTEESVPPEKLFGAGTDADTIVFARYRNGTLEVHDPKPTTKHTVERLLRAIVSLGAQGKSFTPDHLTTDFSSASPVAQKGVRQLYDAIRETEKPKAQTFFNQWKILFGEVCGYDVEGQNAKIRKLAKHYDLTGDPQPAELLFAVHSYYAIFIKFLAAEIVSSFSPLGTSTLKRCVNAHTSAALKREMEGLEQGGIWTQLGITNFLEGDLFSWYLDAWDDRVADVVWDIVKRLDDYDPSTLSVDPGESQDLLKKLYQQLFPKSVRHDLGEYYTPDWLAEHVLNELSYEGDPDKRLLDPGCGSGTFLVMAINRIKNWFDGHRHECGYGEAELIQKILSNVIGFDLNPLAVMAARTNYLMAIRELLRHTDRVEIPVYLCDSIMTPAEYGELFAGPELGKAKILKTAASEFIIPVEVVSTRENIGKYAEQLERCIRNKCDPNEFIARCKEEGLPVTEDELHRRLYVKLQKLDAGNQNGIWARIIKNAFAPLFIERVDYIAGNPPWVFWNNLPGEYRDRVKTMMTDRYEIMAKKASTMKRLGSSGKDLSMLFFYVGLDTYLRPSGKLGFVITQTLFQTTAANEFRRFRLPGNTPIKIERVYDWVDVQPFRKSAGNKTAVVIAIRGEETIYPIPYSKYYSIVNFDREDASLDEVFTSCAVQELEAVPSNSNDLQSFWRIVKPGKSSHSSRTLGASSKIYPARLGIETKLVSAFRVKILDILDDGKLLIENDRSRAKNPVPKREAVIESDLVLPYLSGPSVKRWTFKPAGYYIVPHTAETGMSPIDERTMKSKYPSTYEYFQNLRDELSNRSLHKRWGKGHAFYSIYNIGPYTFSAYRVAWKRSTRNFEASVISTIDDDILGKVPIIADSGLMIVPFDSQIEAHFLCALLNSSISRLRINQSITSTAHKEIIDVVSLPRYQSEDTLHTTLANLSLNAHVAAAEGATDRVTQLEGKIDHAAAELWGITDSELRAIQDTLREMA